VWPHPLTLCREERAPDGLVALVAHAWARRPIALARHGVVVPDLLVRVDVVHAGEHLLMNALHVIRLAEAVGDDLPVAGAARRRGVAARELIEVRPRAVGDDAFEIVAKRLGVAVEVHEDQRTPRLDPRRQQRQLVGREHTESSTGWHLTELTGKAPRPPVI